MQHHMIEIMIEMCLERDISTFQGLCVGVQAFLNEAPDMKKNNTHTMVWLTKFFLFFF